MNLYVHFPFCRSKCAYCALLSRVGTDAAARADYVVARAREVRARCADGLRFETVYFGGGTPGLCDLEPLFSALKAGLAPDGEFTVEVNPKDVTVPFLERLRRGGVNRVSMGAQSFDDRVLAAMGRGVTADATAAAFRLVRSVFPNAGFDLIAGWPAPADAWRRTLAVARALEPVHCSVYTLIREPGTRYDRAVREGRLAPVSDDAALAELAAAEETLAAIGLTRYEISNFARSGYACRHNRAVWRGEDYIGIGEGACGREGLSRTRGVRGPNGSVAYERETLTPSADAVERCLFSLRTEDGIDLDVAASRFAALTPHLPAWRRALDRFVRELLLTRDGNAYRLTPRGLEVCDTILSELVP